MQTYSGRIEAGQFYTEDGTSVPDCPVALLVLESNITDKSQRQLEALHRLQDGIKNCNEPVPEF